MICPVETIGGVIQLGARCASPAWEVIAWTIAGIWIVWLATVYKNS